MTTQSLAREVQQWLADPRPPAGRDVKLGAALLYHINHNRALHRQITIRPAACAQKLEYELRKHLPHLLDGLTREQVAVMEDKVLPAADQSLRRTTPPAFRGRRPDHDRLPPEIQAIYDRGGELFKKIRRTRETLRAMENQTACDRYELCKLLGEADREYRRGWERYDTATPLPAPKGGGSPAHH